MSQFENVTVLKAANIYFDGKVSSRSVLFPDGSRKTLGLMAPGEYEFATDLSELMEITAGRVQVLFPGENEWQEFKGGEAFPVAAHSTFKLRVLQLVDYCCSYV